MNYQHVLITGTTSGIGRGLMEYYAGQGMVVTAVNRNSDRELQRGFPAVRFECIDVVHAEGIKDLMNELIQSNQLPDLLILNAGINCVDNDPVFLLEEFRKVMDTNLLGVLNFVAPLTAMETWPRQTTVMTISSMTNYLGNPYCLGYYLSKLALTKSFEVLEAMYRKTNLKFKWVILGPVPTEITSSSDKFHPFASFVKNLFSVSRTRATQTITNFARSNKKQLIYPMRAFFLLQGLRVLQRLIPGFYQGQKAAEKIGERNMGEKKGQLNDAISHR